MAYFPNGSSGEVLDLQCSRCPLGEGPCPVMGIQMIYNYDQLDAGQEKLRQAMEMLVDEKGICQVHKQLMEVSNEAAKP
jgi:formate hydrogenlyase subunit 6/NADH:ubiquinone oxidoreductase subunit I